jgi:hypothetical protein
MHMGYEAVSTRNLMFSRTSGGRGICDYIPFCFYVPFPYFISLIVFYIVHPLVSPKTLGEVRGTDEKH